MTISVADMAKLGQLPAVVKDDQTYYLQSDTHFLVSRHYGGSLNIIDLSGNFVKNIFYRAEADKDSYFPDMLLIRTETGLSYRNKKREFAAIELKGNPDASIIIQTLLQGENTEPITPTLHDYQI